MYVYIRTCICRFANEVVVTFLDLFVVCEWCQLKKMKIEEPAGTV